jgi:hypothetical protein
MNNPAQKGDKEKYCTAVHDVAEALAKQLEGSLELIIDHIVRGVSGKMGNQEIPAAKPQKIQAIRSKASELYLKKGLNFKQIAKELGASIPTVSKALQTVGILSPLYISKHYPTLEDLMSRRVGSVQLYGKEKQREEMIRAGAEALGSLKDVSYLGLEGPNFTSYILVSQKLGVNPKTSVIPEHERNVYNLMRSIVNANESIDGGKIFRGLNLYRGTLEYAIQQPEFRKFKFNWANLDYEGGMCPDKARTITALFEGRKFADNAVLFVTVNNEPRMQKHCAEDFGQEDQAVALTGVVTENAAAKGYKAEMIHECAYTSKITRNKPMLLVGYKITR